MIAEIIEKIESLLQEVKRLRRASSKANLKELETLSESYFSIVNKFPKEELEKIRPTEKEVINHIDHLKKENAEDQCAFDEAWGNLLYNIDKTLTILKDKND
ncbi:hypothetical protein [Olivibacter sp. XZL3]|uniref:hypothetical protein n=1 Tax=Olivibacter sp. XZL3 TaxID=1735116 RepID=UPI0010667E71|nr:hypothetical protein [Olivibacter sp. XZL3]